MPIRLYRSNRTERLAERLGDVLATPLAHPLARELISVQGTGMERWLSMTLARRFGVFAGAEFPFPRGLVERVLAAGLGPTGATLPFDARGLGWAVADLIRTAPADDPRLDEVTRYLERSEASDAWLDLGMRLGEVFDRMLLYRPELTARYEAGEHDDLRAALWRMLVERHGADHLASRAARYLRLAESGASLVEHDPAFPARIVLFGVSSLPPLFMRVLSALSSEREVHLFALTPTREFMGDVSRRSTRNDALALLGAVGRLSRDFQELLESEVQYEELDADLFVDPGCGTALHGLQSDLLNMHSRGEGAELSPLPLPTDDASIRVHDCHSRTRELEVLRDQILQRLQEDRSLRPRDVVVLAPDIEHYAPAIQAVFGGDGPAAALPHRIADRELGRSSPLASATLALLDLLGSRVTLGELADFLHRPLVHARFGLAAADAPLLVGWLEAAGARWGLTDEARTRHGQPRDRAGSMRFALERMWLGHAMAGEGDPLWRDVLPFDDVEGQAARLQGLGSFVESLQEWDARLATPLSCGELAARVDEAVDAFVVDAAGLAGERKLLRDALAAVRGGAEAAGCHAPITLRSFRRLLDDELSARAPSHDFLQGGITFCRHVPMRALPFRVVCLLGMDDESFPRRVPSASFDPVTERPRRGDRTPADDDRQVFLEALLSAREHLIITHCGRGIEDNAVRPRAAVVDQLLDVLDAGWVPTDNRGVQSLFDARARDRVLQEHMLWPFDARYFDAAPDARWFTYDALAATARRALARPDTALAPFVSAPLSDRDPSSTVTVDELVRFFRHPTRAYLQRGLDLVLPRDQPPLPDREPAMLWGLDRYHVATFLHEGGAHASEDARGVLHARSLLPLGDAGRLELDVVAGEVLQLQQAGHLPGTAERITLDCQLDDVRVVGELDDVYPAAWRQVLVATASAKHQLAFWVWHLALCTQSPRAGLLVSRDKGKPAIQRVEPVHEARELLADLVRIYQRGLRLPLPLFPEASLAYARAHAKHHGDEAAALAAADAALNAGGFDGRSPGDDSQLNQVYGLATRRRVAETAVPGLAPDEAFGPLALRVFGPLLAAEAGS